ncbi:MAG: acyl-CoA dehydrogenase [Halieaceae bacterium]|jgi:alkylation response protein AidB-like acyl-CoA dehydrogenase|nr:acyl-CoA dehydrogenase [Halieaceae bacterium]MBT5134017.1 acyl-CoA dehydrogenase [Halieaceae bacterium]MBT5555902.1 acyl-CoA dehydrogenase [Halieaceae bacterium]MBT6180590.1 acyl-CoA dehydrogenase [Halieaceae bacterium]
MYKAPLDDMQFLIDDVCQAGARLGDLPRFEGLEVGTDLTTALLEEASKLAADVVAPLRRVGDQQPARCADGAVTIPPGYGDAIRALGDGGWVGISADSGYGGQGLPELYGTAACEMWNSADMAFALEPFLSSGAALAISAHGSDALKDKYLPNINAGVWSGTMNLTESGAGSDLGPMKTRAERHGDHYRIFGQKIYITWGDHDATENIIHLVLARLPDAPQGSKGISLFVVPKFLVNDDGSLGDRNDAYPVSVEHKLGIHGSPTCVMAYGDQDGAIGYLVGQENNGLACMFTMMNEARLKVGLQGLGASEGAYQKAVAYARERVQGGVAIIEHADVKRMLMSMRALNEAMRALAYIESLTMDLSHGAPAQERGAWKARLDLMIPVIKGWMTEVGQEVTSVGVQIHGGMGYVEETGAAQFFRDVRITSIYEGTNGIQAADLVGRKLARDGGATMELVHDEIRQVADALAGSSDDRLAAMGCALSDALATHVMSSQTILELFKVDKSAAMSVSFDYMMQTGYLFGGWHLAASSLVAIDLLSRDEKTLFCQRKIATTEFYLHRLMPRGSAHADAILSPLSQLDDYAVEWL